MTNIKKQQIRRTPSGDYYMVIYIDHRIDPENDSCIILDMNGVLRKELSKVVDEWTLIFDPNVDQYVVGKTYEMDATEIKLCNKCDLFLKELFKNL